MPSSPTIQPIISYLSTETLHALEPEALKIMSDLFDAIASHLNHAVETHPKNQ